MKCGSARPDPSEIAVEFAPGEAGKLLDGWVPFPPRVETSSLGDAAVLTGALSVGLTAALENVFVNRTRR